MCTMEVASYSTKFLFKKELFFYNSFFNLAYFVRRSYSFFSLFLSFFIPTFLPFIVNNFFHLNKKKKVEQNIASIIRFKKRNLVISDVNRVQVRAAFGFIKKRDKSDYSNLMKSIAPLWNSRYFKFLKTRNSKKVQRKRSFFFKKKFALIQKNQFKNIKSIFFGGRVRKKRLMQLLKRHKNKSYNALSILFTLNSIKVINRVFPFFDRFFILKLVRFGFFSINFKKIVPKNSFLKIGDFVTFFSISRFNKIYRSWIRKQRFYIRLLYKNLFQHFRSRFLKQKPKNYLRRATLFNNMYKPIPSWLEVNYLSLSFFVIKRPSTFSFRSYNFNPFLFKLLLY